jgi:hypothetical protein
MTPMMFHHSAFLKNMMVVKKLKLFGINLVKDMKRNGKSYMIRLKRKIKKFLLFVEHNHYHLLLQSKMCYGVGLKLLIIQ